MSIPIRNIWWLMLYASDLGDAQNKSLKGKEDLPEEIPDLIAKILIKTVEKRLKRQLTYSFETKDEVLNNLVGLDKLTKFINNIRYKIIHNNLKSISPFAVSIIMEFYSEKISKEKIISYKEENIEQELVNEAYKID